MDRGQQSLEQLLDARSTGLFLQTRSRDMANVCVCGGHHHGFKHIHYNRHCDVYSHYACCSCCGSRWGLQANLFAAVATSTTTRVGTTQCMAARASRTTRIFVLSTTTGGLDPRTFACQSASEASRGFALGGAPKV